MCRLFAALRLVVAGLRLRVVARLLVGVAVAFDLGIGPGFVQIAGMGRLFCRQLLAVVFVFMLQVALHHRL